MTRLRYLWWWPMWKREDYSIGLKYVCQWNHNLLNRSGYISVGGRGFGVYVSISGPHGSVTVSAAHRGPLWFGRLRAAVIAKFLRWILNT